MERNDYYNSKWYEYTGFEKGSVPEAWRTILHPDDVEMTKRTYLNSITTGNPYQVEYRFKNSSGDYRWFLARALPIRDGNNKVIKWFGTCTDIHDTKILSEELEKRVEERTRELMEANLALKRTNEELEQFAYIRMTCRSHCKKSRFIPDRLKGKI